MCGMVKNIRRSQSFGLALAMVRLTRKRVCVRCTDGSSVEAQFVVSNGNEIRFSCFAPNIGHFAYYYPLTPRRWAEINDVSQESTKEDMCKLGFHTQRREE